MAKTRVVRCPKCGSTKAAADENRSRAEVTYMQCPACGFGEPVDLVGVGEWNAEVELPEGCGLPDKV
ncbi:MAG: hypothetical protein ABI867_28110 [Kofleriaceae bacterium]